MSDYVKDLQICSDAIFDLWREVNDHLPDYNGKYLIDWDLTECNYIKDSLHAAASTVLSTVMMDHVAYEVRSAIDTYDAAFKKKDIAKCKAAFLNCCEVFREIRIVCQRAKTQIIKQEVCKNV